MKKTKGKRTMPAAKEIDRAVLNAVKLLGEHMEALRPENKPTKETIAAAGATAKRLNAELRQHKVALQKLRHTYVQPCARLVKRAERRSLVQSHARSPKKLPEDIW